MIVCLICAYKWFSLLYKSRGRGLLNLKFKFIWSMTSFCNLISKSFSITTLFTWTTSFDCKTELGNMWVLRALKDGRWVCLWISMPKYRCKRVNDGNIIARQLSLDFVITRPGHGLDRGRRIWSAQQWLSKLWDPESCCVKGWEVVPPGWKVWAFLFLSLWKEHKVRNRKVWIEVPALGLRAKAFKTWESDCLSWSSGSAPIQYWACY